MSALTIKNFPDKLLNALRHEAESRRRSVTQEVLKRLEESVAAKNHANSQLAQDQVDNWRKLSGRWKSHLSVKEEIDQLYRARRRGRKIKL